MVFDIEKVKSKIDKRIEEERKLENRRSVLHEAEKRGLIAKPLLLKFSFWYFFCREVIYYCPCCKAKLEREHFSFSFLTNCKAKYIHLICPNEDYETVIEQSWF